MAATTDQLDRIATLSAALAPLAGKQRGMRIESDDWNALVAAIKGVLEIDRAQEEVTSGALADTYATRIHEHLGNVSLAWLASDLQARIGDVTAAASVAGTINELRRRLDASQQDVARLTAAVENLQRRLDRSSVDNVDRTNRLRTYEDRLTGLEDLRTSVAKASTTVDQLGPQINEVLALKGQLTDPAGNAIDLGAIREDIASLQGLRESVVGVTGDPLRLQDFETEIADIRNQLKQNAGDERLTKFEGDLTGRLVATFDAKSAETRAAILADTEAAQEDARKELRAGLEDARTAIDQAVATRMGEAETRLSATMDARDAKLSAEVTGATKAQIDAAMLTVNAQTDQKLTTMEGRFTNIVDTRITNLPGHQIVGPVVGPIVGPIGAPAVRDPKPPDRAAARPKRSTGKAHPTSKASATPPAPSSSKAPDEAKAPDRAKAPAKAKASDQAKAADTAPKQQARRRSGRAPGTNRSG